MPEAVKAAPREQHTRDNEDQSTHKSKDNSKYLRLLQNYQMEDRIELTLDRVVATFFKAENVKKEEQEAVKDIEEEYQLLL